MTHERNPRRLSEQEKTCDIEFTGERLVPGKAEPDLFNEHFARYVYARQFCTGKAILDTGCGVGYGSRYIAEEASSVVGIDNDPAAIAYARTNFSSLNTQYLVADSHNIPFETGSFDVVTSFELIEHLPRATDYLAEVRRVLKPDGVLIVSTPNHTVYSEHRGGEPNPFHVQEWDFDDFAALLKQYFSQVEFLGENHVAGVAILSERARTQVPAALQAPASPSTSDYFVCVCSQRAVETKPGLVFVPASANVLRERERHISALNREVSRLEEKERWAENLNSDLARTRTDYARLESENKRLATEVEILAAMWRKETRLKRLITFGLLWPIDWLVAATLIGSQAAGKAARSIAATKVPEFPVPKPECSFIIVSWNGKDLLAQSLPPLLEAVRKQCGNHEVIVVDNGSVDGTRDFVRQNFPEIVLVRSEENLYFSGGNRLGMEKATRDIVVLLNNDMIVDPDFLAPLLKPFCDAQVFGVGSQVFLPAGKPRQETGKTRANFNGAELEWKHDRISTYDENQGYVPVFWLHGGAAAIDRRKYVWLGGLDPLYDPFYVEDADLSYRAWKAGWKCLLAVDSHVLHKHRSSTQRFGEGFIRGIVRRNQYIFFWKNFSDPNFVFRNLLHEPRLRARRAGMVGTGIKNEIHSCLGAVKRLPAILKAKFAISRYAVRNDRQILTLINEPEKTAIAASDVDFSRGTFDEQLSGQWYDFETDGRPHRWVGGEASVSLRTPAANVELLVQGYAPSLSQYPKKPVTLTVSCADHRDYFDVAGGEFSYSVPLRSLAVGEPVRVDLSVDPTFKVERDERTLGVIVHRVALVKKERWSGTRTNVDFLSISGQAHPQTPASGEPAKRLLMICAYMPCTGLHGGGTVMYHLIRQLSRKYRITVLSFFETDADRELASALLPFCERLEALRRGQSLDMPNLLGLTPPEIAHEFYNVRMQDRVDELLQSGSFDVVDCQYLQTGHFVLNHPEVPAVLTHHEVYSLAITKQRARSLWKRARKFVKWMRMLNYEAKVFRRFSSVMVFTEAEQHYLNRYMPRVSVRAHATGVDCDFFRPQAGAPEHDCVMFLGNFRHQPNVNGILWFLESCWQRVLRERPEARLLIVGAEPPNSVQRWHGRDNVIVTGKVPDVRPYFHKCLLSVAPLLEGAGLRGKILEAWAMQRAVVGTPLAFLGLEDDCSEAGLIANDATTFSSCVCQLLTDNERAQAMGARARELAVSNYSWQAFADCYDEAYRQAIENRAQDPTGAHTSAHSAQSWRNENVNARSV
jgi:GT2 family glycosyltransferase/SAM-dependent methyltransferase/glycosyltransferase involved in cell wall biosynthesis